MKKFLLIFARVAFLMTVITGLALCVPFMVHYSESTALSVAISAVGAWIAIGAFLSLIRDDIPDMVYALIEATR